MSDNQKTPKTVELHLIQSFPPSCVNRDGNNAPKDCTFGGSRRARISSQCLKRAIRQADSFTEIVEGAVATRSKQMRDKKLVPYLIEKGKTQEEAEDLADKFRVKLAKNDSKKKQLTSVGLYFGDDELFALMDAFLADDSKWADKGTKKSTDVALFGRMLAEATGLNVDAAAQVAHAISTHKLSQEMDYWTAADDLKDSSEDAGAGMLGTAEFNASVFYRYACVNLPVLSGNLANENGLYHKTVEAFLRASYDAIPTGKINGHAHLVPPVFALATVRRKGMPLNLVNAYLNPVRPGSDGDFAVSSGAAMLAHLTKMRAMSPVDDADYAMAHALDADLQAEGVELLGGYGKLIEWVMERLS